MHVLLAILLAYLALGLQLGLGAHLRLAGAEPNLVLLAAVLLAVGLPRSAAPLACLGLGLLHDLVAGGVPGVYGLSYGLVGWAGAQGDEQRRGTGIASLLLLTLVGGVVVAAVQFTAGTFRPPRPTLGALAIGIVYTVAIAAGIALLTRLAQLSRRA